VDGCHVRRNKAMMWKGGYYAKYDWLSTLVLVHTRNWLFFFLPVILLCNACRADLFISPYFFSLPLVFCKASSHIFPSPPPSSSAGGLHWCLAPCPCELDCGPRWSAGFPPPYRDQQEGAHRSQAIANIELDSEQAMLWFASCPTSHRLAHVQRADLKHACARAFTHP